MQPGSLQSLPPASWKEKGPRKKKNNQKPTQDSRKATTRTHRSLLPVEVALQFRVLADSTDGSSATTSWTPNAVRLADGPVHKNNHHQSKIQQLNQAKEQSKDSQIHTWVSMCQRRTFGQRIPTLIIFGINLHERHQINSTTRQKYSIQTTIYYSKQYLPRTPAGSECTRKTGPPDYVLQEHCHPILQLSEILSRVYRVGSSSPVYWKAR